MLYTVQYSSACQHKCTRRFTTSTSDPQGETKTVVGTSGKCTIVVVKYDTMRANGGGKHVLGGVTLAETEVAFRGRTGDVQVRVERQLPRLFFFTATTHFIALGLKLWVLIRQHKRTDVMDE